MAEQRANASRKARLAGAWSALRPRAVAAGQILAGLAAVAVVTSGGLLLGAQGEATNVVIAYLFAIAAVSTRFGQRAAVISAVASALAADYFFLPPYSSFTIQGPRDLVTFAGMLVTAVFLSSLQERLRKQARAARHSERRTEALYALARELVDATSVEALCTRAAAQIEVAAGAVASILLRDGAAFSRAFGARGVIGLDTEDLQVAAWAAAHVEVAGAGARNRGTTGACYVPLVSGRGCVGVVALRQPGNEDDLWAAPRPSSLVMSMIRQLAVALDRALLTEEKQRAQLEAETERIRSAVLSSVSHDLRTPLAVITSASSALLEHGDRIPGPARAEMCRMIHDEGRRLNGLLKSLLDVTRLQAGNLHVARDWESLEEVIGSVLRRVEEQTFDRHVRTNVPSDVPLLQIDATLIEQVLLNLIDNAFKHSLSEQSVDIDVTTREDHVQVSVIDHGRGVHSDELDHIFDKFYRNEKVVSAGLGLGLTIARGIIQAHRGRIWATHTPGGGLTVHFTLLLTGSPPRLTALTGVEEGALQEPA